MRGFIVGSLALIALETLLRKRNTDQVAGAGAVLISAVHRLLSPGVAGIPNRAPASKAPAPAAAQQGTSTTQASAPQVGRTLTTQYV